MPDRQQSTPPAPANPSKSREEREHANPEQPIYGGKWGEGEQAHPGPLDPSGSLVSSRHGPGPDDQCVDDDEDVIDTPEGGEAPEDDSD